ncbi:DUF4199 domain-containing protein [Psychroflexus sp. CAK57W]|uniref:DUF4199 domain-containing protein n=1 Tax=Psychroflexus curvus TaxID=2873595 RepID=UPI001CCF270A|nr:DUF4199 domain-containing protein [Psychroflexus curvus]MBZ9629106.1 DUF4199 domain-containing protein [Psychroflexus curvus]MBZ9786706.1 DUF4199 domain-containing protein [Psychroflexus curvus]
MKKFEIELKWASAFTAISIAWVYFEKFLGYHDGMVSSQAIFSFWLMIPQALIYVVAIRQKRERYYNGEITWQKAFISGVVLSAIIAGLSPAAIYIMLEFVSPDFLANIVEAKAEQGMPREGLRQIYNLNSMVTQAIFNNLGTGVFFSAIIALFLKNKKV